MHQSAHADTLDSDLDEHFLLKCTGNGKNAKCFTLQYKLFRVRRKRSYL